MNEGTRAGRRQWECSRAQTPAHTADVLTGAAQDIKRLSKQVERSYSVNRKAETRFRCALAEFRVRAAADCLRVRAACW